MSNARVDIERMPLPCFAGATYRRPFGWQMTPLRFISRLRKNWDHPWGCWEWTDRQWSNGYGVFREGGRSIYAHRFAWAIVNGDPGDLFVCHRCDNPPCCTPTHFFLGTAKDNAEDRDAKGRGWRGGWPDRPPHKPLRPPREALVRRSHKLRPEHVLMIRKEWASSEHLAQEDLARRFGVHQSTVSDILSGRTWRKLLAPIPAQLGATTHHG